MKEIELKFNEQTITVFYKKENVGTIRLKTNPYHNQNYYLDMDFVTLDFAEVRELFEEINAFLTEKGMTKVDFIKEAYEIMKKEG